MAADIGVTTMDVVLFALVEVVIFDDAGVSSSDIARHAKLVSKLPK